MTDHYDFKRSLKARDPYPFLRYFPIERYFTRPLASLIARAVYKTTVTPNQLTLTSLFLGLISGAAYLGGNHGYFILGGVLYQISSIFDCADGMLARSKGMQTEFGAFLDLFCDRITDFVVLIGLNFGYFLSTGNERLLVLCLFSTAGFYLGISLYYLLEQYRKHRAGRSAEARGFTVFMILLFSLLNRLDLFIYLGSVWVILNLIYLVSQLIRLRSPRKGK